MNDINKIVTINSRKFDQQIHRSWMAELISQEESLLLFLGKFDKEVTHPHLGVIRRGTLSYEFYWMNCWFNVFRFHEPEGELRNFYCNINLPPTFLEGVLDYVDLEIDVVIWKDFTYQILDMDEFEENAVRFNYSAQIYDKAIETLSQLKDMIEKKSYPFSTF